MPGHRDRAVAGYVVTYRGYSGTAIASTSGRTVIVGRFLPPCFGSTTAVARETTAQVRLWLRDVVPARHGVCNMMVAIRDSQVIRLAKPLGGRTLVDGATGQAVAWISARLVLRPTVLPAGYRLLSLTPAVNFAAPESPRPAGCTIEYGTPSSAGMLVISQSADGLPLLRPGPGWTAIRVGGLPGWATRNQITWRENGLTDSIVATIPQWPRELTTAQLIAIAGSA